MSCDCLSRKGRVGDCKPIGFVFLENYLLEHLPDWPRPPVGAVVTDRVQAQVLRWILADPEYGVRHVARNTEARDYIDAIAGLFDVEIAGSTTAEQREAAAARAARAAKHARSARKKVGCFRPSNSPGPASGPPPFPSCPPLSVERCGWLRR
jgi:hypothetical protein